MAATAARTSGLAIATAAAISIYAGAAYAMHMDVKGKEGKGSMYKPTAKETTVGKGGDEHLSPKAIHEVVSKRSSRVKPVVEK
ncbi:hypothetical protein VNI00_006547 [Paramarasmius palmivorus]|uniref:Uncharacterized protein n=1 Tax=Paramarasmius palmivorus TaxID=297713 RepID=A0AAW0D4E4_9AGAR